MENKEPIKKSSILTDEDKRDLTLAVRKEATNVLNPVEYEQNRLVANDLFKSNAVPKCIQNADQAFMVVMAGAEMGLKPIESIQSLYIINGVTTLWGKAVPKQIRRHGYRFEFFNETKDSCSIRVWKKDEEYTDTFTFSDAELSGYTKDSYGKVKVGWKEGQNRKLKLRYGVLSSILKTYIPEVLGSVSDIAEIARDYIEGEEIRSSNSDTSEALSKAVTAISEANTYDELKTVLKGLEAKIIANKDIIELKNKKKEELNANN